MTRQQRQALKLACLAVLPAAAFVIDASLYVSLKAWTYSLRESGASVFWPAVLTLGAFCFPLAALCLGSDLFRNWSTGASARWPLAEGRVTGGRIQVNAETRGKSIVATYETYAPKVAYAYEAAGATYRGDLPDVDVRRKTREEAEEVLRSYPVGTPVRLHYDPDDPATTAFQVRDGWAFRSTGGALFFAVVPFVAAWLIIALH